MTQLDAPREGTARREVLRTWLPTAIYIILILTMALRPSPRLPPIRHIDKYLHAAAYAVLALLAYHALVRSGCRHPLILTLLLGLAVGMADEGVQALGRVRRADRYDLLADLVGTAIGALIISRSLMRAQGSVRGTGTGR